MAEKIRVGVIGVGRLGAIHSRLWKACEGAELVGIYDEDQGRSAEVATENDTQAFTELPALLASVDAVSIATPTTTHAAIAERALEAGVHCFIEKPITVHSSEARALIDMAQSKGLMLQVGHVERFNPAFLALQKHDVRPMFIETHRLAQFTPRATDVAVVLDLMIHDIDLTLFLVKSAVKEVRASGVSVVSDTIDIANARLEFENGCVANLTASRISQKQMRKMRLFQQDAYISVDFAKPSAELFRIKDAGAAGNDGPTMLLGAIELGTQHRNIYYEQLTLEKVNAIAMEFDEFVSAIRDGTPPPVTATEAAEALRIAEEIVGKIAESTLLLASADQQTNHV